MNEADTERLRHLLTSCRWRFARTMPENPHFYSLRKDWESDEDFVWAVLCIRQHGIQESFKGRWYVVLYLGDFKYWTLGSPIDQTTLINRTISPQE